jgi:hypothetical protein
MKRMRRINVRNEDEIREELIETQNEYSELPLNSVQARTYYESKIDTLKWILTEDLTDDGD